MLYYYHQVIMSLTISFLCLLLFVGYRDAQVGWVEVCEDLSHDREHPSVQARRALFLIIYAARRGILEVSCGNNGPHHPVNTTHRTNTALALAQCLQHRLNNKPAVVQCIMFIVM